MVFNLSKKKVPSEALEDIKEELDEHLGAINENTSEIQSNFEYLSELNSKIERLSQRLDQIQMFLKMKTKEKKYSISPLTPNEKEIFLVLYTSENDALLTYSQIAKKVCLPELLVSEYITSLIAKGLPVHKKFVNNTAVISLDPDFKEVQAKENLIQL